MFSETLEFIYQTSRCHNPGGQNMYNDGREMVNFLLLTTLQFVLLHDQQKPYTQAS